MKTPKNVLITGSLGFIGSHLASRLRSAQFQVLTPEFQLLDYASIDKAFRQIKADGTELDILIHLAGISHIPTCENDPTLAIQTNLGGTTLLLHALRTHFPKAVLVFASTGQVYSTKEMKARAEEIAFTEDSPISPQNLYATTKWQAELLIRDASEHWGLNSVILRLFNHTHFTQAPDFFLPKIYHELKKAKDGDKIAVGDLSVYRDIGSIVDLLTVLEKLTVKLTGGDSVKLTARQTEELSSTVVFNVASGIPKNLQKLAEGLREKLGVQCEFVTDAKFLRPGEAASIKGNSAKLYSYLGISPSSLNEGTLIEQFLAEIE